MSAYKLLIVDDQKIVREGLGLLLSRYEDLRIVGEAADGFEAIKQCRNLQPDLILMDLRMPLMNGMDAVLRIKRENSMVKVLILTTFNEQDLILKALQNGADGYVLKDSGSEDIKAAIDQIMRGQVSLHPEVATTLVNMLKLQGQGTNGEYKLESHDPPSDVEVCLTPKEKDIAFCIRKGMGNKEIAAQLFISEGTVKNHVSNILSKYGFKNRTEIALLKIHD